MLSQDRMIKYNFFSPLRCKLAELDLQRVKVMKSHSWLFPINMNVIIIVEGNADLFYQETDLCQISPMTSSKTVKISGPSFLYTLTQHVSLRNRCQHAQSTLPDSLFLKNLCVKPVFLEEYFLMKLLLRLRCSLRVTEISNVAITHNRYSKQYVLHCLKGI